MGMKQDAIFGMEHPPGGPPAQDVHQEPPRVLTHDHCVTLSRPGLSKVVQKSCARCVLDASCTTVILGVVGSCWVFLHVPHAFGKMLVRKSDSRFECQVWHSWHSLSCVDTPTQHPITSTSTKGLLTPLQRCFPGSSLVQYGPRKSWWCGSFVFRGSSISKFKPYRTHDIFVLDFHKNFLIWHIGCGSKL